MSSSLLFYNNYDFLNFFSACRPCGDRCACIREHELDKVWGWESQPSFLPQRGKVSPHHKAQAFQRYKAPASLQFEARPVDK